MIHCKELNQDFSTKQDLFKALKENKEQIITEKKAAIQKSFEKNLGVNAKFLDNSKLQGACKSISVDNDYY